MLKSAVLALLILLAAPAAALAQPSPASAELQNKINAEMIVISQRMQPTMAMQQDAMKVLLDLIERSQEAIQLGEKRASRGEVDRWLASWEPVYRSTSGELRARFNDVKPLTAGEVPTVVSLGALQGMNPDVLLSGPTKSRDLGLAILDTADELATNIRQGAGGDEKARTKLARNTFIGPTTLVRTEVTMIEFSMAGLPEKHPQHALYGSMLESDLSMLELFLGMQAEIDGRPMDPKAVGKRVSSHVVAGQAQAQDCDRLTVQFLEDMSQDPNANSPYGRKVASAMSTFRESAKVEAELFAVIERLAARLQRGESILAVATSLDEIDGPVKRRGAIQRSRVQMLAQ